LSADAALVVPRPAKAPDDLVAYALPVAARKLGKSTRTLMRLYQAGEMPGRRLGRSLMVPAGWVDAFGAIPADSKVA
jgi:hypothetical protein